MDQTVIFPILLFLTKRNIMKLLLNPNDKYLWKLLFIRDYDVNKIIGSYYNTYVLCNSITFYKKINNKLYMLRSYLSDKMNRYDYLRILLIGENINIPSEIGKCINLEDLDIQPYKIYIIPTEIGCCIKLTNLCIQRIELRYLPTEIGKLVNLQKVHAAFNKLLNIPSEIGNCVNLYIFDISNNKLLNIPTEIGKCIKLIYMRIENNEIQSIPTEMSKCVCLGSLIISNSIKNIPNEIRSIIYKN